MRFWLLRLFAFCAAVGLLLLPGGFGCQGGCVELSSAYALSGCLGEGECKTSQTNCQVRFECGTAFQFCQGFMVGREIDMRCAATDGHSFTANIGVNETSLRFTVIKGGAICQAELKPK